MKRKADPQKGTHLAACCAKVAEDAEALVAVSLVRLQTAACRAVPQPNSAVGGDNGWDQEKRSRFQLAFLFLIARRVSLWAENTAVQWRAAFLCFSRSFSRSPLRPKDDPSLTCPATPPEYISRWAKSAHWTRAGCRCLWQEGSGGE